MDVRVDQQTCVGCGLCVLACAEAFELTGRQVAQVKRRVVPSELAATCRKAAADCPIDAIRLEGPDRPQAVP